MASQSIEAQLQGPSSRLPQIMTAWRILVIRDDAYAPDDSVGSGCVERRGYDTGRPHTLRIHRSHARLSEVCHSDGKLQPRGRAVAFREEMVARYPDYYAPEMYGNEAKLEAQQVLWFPRDMVARMKTETPRAAELLLRDIDKVGAPGDRWFLGNTQVESLPERAGYYLGYLFAQSVGEHVELPTLARMPLEQVRQKELAFLTDLARH
jgi:hypothetical protein